MYYRRPSSYSRTSFSSSTTASTYTHVPATPTISRSTRLTSSTFSLSSSFERRSSSDKVRMKFVFLYIVAVEGKEYMRNFKGHTRNKVKSCVTRAKNRIRSKLWSSSINNNNNNNSNTDSNGSIRNQDQVPKIIITTANNQIRDNHNYRNVDSHNNDDDDNIIINNANKVYKSLTQYEYGENSRPIQSTTNLTSSSDVVVINTDHHISRSLAASNSNSASATISPNTNNINGVAISLSSALINSVAITNKLEKTEYTETTRRIKGYGDLTKRESNNDLYTSSSNSLLLTEIPTGAIIDLGVVDMDLNLDSDSDLDMTKPDITNVTYKNSTENKKKSLIDNTLSPGGVSNNTNTDYYQNNDFNNTNDSDNSYDEDSDAFLTGSDYDKELGELYTMIDKMNLDIENKSHNHNHHKNNNNDIDDDDDDDGDSNTMVVIECPYQIMKRVASNERFMVIEPSSPSNRNNMFRPRNPRISSSISSNSLGLSSSSNSSSNSNSSSSYSLRDSYYEGDVYSKRGREMNKSIGKRNSANSKFGNAIEEGSLVNTDGANISNNRGKALKVPSTITSNNNNNSLASKSSPNVNNSGTKGNGVRTALASSSSHSPKQSRQRALSTLTSTSTSKSTTANQNTDTTTTTTTKSHPAQPVFLAIATHRNLQGQALEEFQQGLLRTIHNTMEADQKNDYGSSSIHHSPSTVYVLVPQSH